MDPDFVSTPGRHRKMSNKERSELETRRSHDAKHGEGSYQGMKAKADLMEETRLAEKAKNQRNLAVAADKIRSKLPKTGEALGHLGAGKSYGE